MLAKLANSPNRDRGTAREKHPSSGQPKMPKGTAAVKCDSETENSIQIPTNKSQNKTGHGVDRSNLGACGTYWRKEEGW
jgi:hypothetical protein